MYAQTFSAPSFAAADAPGLPVADRRVAMLDRLAEMGMDLAGMVHRRGMAMAEPPVAGAGALDGAVADVTVAFDRVARAVRRTVSLARLLEMPVLAGVGGRPGQSGPVSAARARVIRAVEDTIHRNSDGERAESLRAELLERMDAPEFDDAMDGRPVEEVIRDIERDLGIGGIAGFAAPWVRRTPEMVVALQARARGEAPPMVPGPEPAKAADWTPDLTGLALVLAAVPGRGSGRGPP